MKTKISILLILSYAILSCNDSENMNIESYLKDSITLSINTPMSITQKVSTMTRLSTSALQAPYEDINLYIFDEKGNLFDYSYTTKSAELKNLKLSVWLDREYSIYAIANARQSIYVKTIDELIEKSYPLSSHLQVDSKSPVILMTGHIPPRTLEDGMSLELTLTRSAAKISLQVNFENLSTETSIKINKVSLKNIPNKVNLFKDSRAVNIEDIIIEGDSRKGSDLTEIQTKGCFFYIYENMQGDDLLPRNTTQKGKNFKTSDPRSKLCSYLEVESEYNSPIYTGTIKHRFYLGEDYLSNFNIIRNKHYTHTLTFDGSGINEISWRIGIDDLKEYIINLDLPQSEYIFRKLQETKQISATILPYTAYNQNLDWSSSDPSIATVDKSGQIKSISEGSCSITATTTDGSSKTATTKIIVEIPQITISSPDIMFKGESAKASVTVVTPSNTPITWSSSNESIITIDELGNIRAVGVGRAKIRGQIIKNTYSEHRISVVPLTISLSSPPSTFYIGFKEAITYSITPTHAEKLHKQGKLPITWTTENDNINNTENVYWGNKIGTDKIIGYFTNFSDISSSQDITTLEALSINTTYHSKDPGIQYIRILNNAEFSKKKNIKHSDISTYHQVNPIKHHSARVIWTSSNRNIKINPKNQIYSTDASFFATNGKHDLIGSIVDDFDVTHKIKIQLRVYEEVNIIILYTKSDSGNPSGEDLNTSFTYSMSAMANKDVGNIDFYHHDASWSIREKEGWDTYVNSYNGDGSNPVPTESTKLRVIYRSEPSIIEDSSSPDGYFRYYVSVL